MKVKELKEYLEYCNDDDIVVISSDSEGNEYNECWSINVNRYAFNEECNEIKLRPPLRDHEKSIYGEEDLADTNHKNCVVIWP